MLDNDSQQAGAELSQAQDSYLIFFFGFGLSWFDEFPWGKYPIASIK